MFDLTAIPWDHVAFSATLLLIASFTTPNGFRASEIIRLISRLRGQVGKQSSQGEDKST